MGPWTTRLFVPWVVAALSGCAGPGGVDYPAGDRTPVQSAAPAEPEPYEYRAASPQPARPAAPPAAAPEPAASTPEPAPELDGPQPKEQEVREPPDAGAIAFVRYLRRNLDVPEGDIRIALSGLANQSRTGAAEFERLQRRLVGLLDRAAPETMRFTADDEEDADFVMEGTAYLVTRFGTDQWELYFTFRPARRSWCLWRLDRPLRVLRQPRPNAPEVLPGQW